MAEGLQDRALPVTFNTGNAQLVPLMRSLNLHLGLNFQITANSCCIKKKEEEKRNTSENSDDVIRGADWRYAEKGLHPQTDTHVNRARDDGVEILLQGFSLLLGISCSGQGSDWAGAVQ